MELVRLAAAAICPGRIHIQIHWGRGRNTNMDRALNKYRHSRCSRAQAKSARAAVWSPQIFILRFQRSCWNETSYCSLCLPVCLPACLSLFSPDVRRTSQQLRQEMSPQAVKRLIHFHTAKRDQNKTCAHTQKKLCRNDAKALLVSFFAYQFALYLKSMLLHMRIWLL